MADSGSLKVLCIFEAAGRLEYSSELTCLAAHIYHRFFRLKPLSQFDLYTFAAAAIKLAHWFYEQTLDSKNLCLVLNNILHGQDLYLNENNLLKIERSIDLAAKVICSNLDYQINFKDTRMTTPGILQERFREEDAQLLNARKKPAIVVEFSSDDEDSSDLSEEEGGLTKDDILLSKIDRNQAGSHRYLAHYLKTIKLLIKPDVMDQFDRISNLAWTFLSDYHWSPCVTQIYSNHLACACLIMAIETLRPELNTNRHPDKKELWKLLDKRWNLILCDDFPSKLLNRAIVSIVGQYDEYHRLLQHEFSTYVIDPLRR